MNAADVARTTIRRFFTKRADSVAPNIAEDFTLEMVARNVAVGNITYFQDLFNRIEAELELTEDD
jgi:hypothetical protein